jgi:hypothetical protein
MGFQYHHANTATLRFFVPCLYEKSPAFRPGFNSFGERLTAAHEQPQNIPEHQRY